MATSFIQSPVFLGLLSVFGVSLISFVGAALFAVGIERIKNTVFILVSLSVGALFGDVFFHLVPEAFEEAGSGVMVSFWILGGIVAFFIFEKFLLWHHHHDGDESTHGHPRHLGPMVLVSDGLHNMVDGIVIAASFLISIEVGIATTIAVILHEIPQEIADFGLLVHSGMSRTRALMFNFFSALTAVIAAAVVFMLGSSVSIIEPVLPYIVAFAAGTFIYIAGSDLVPELHKHKSTRASLIQLGSICAGILIMAILLLLE